MPLPQYVKYDALHECADIRAKKNKIKYSKFQNLVRNPEEGKERS